MGFSLPETKKSSCSSPPNELLNALTKGRDTMSITISTILVSNLHGFESIEKKGSRKYWTSDPSVLI